MKALFYLLLLLPLMGKSQMNRKIDVEGFEAQTVKLSIEPAYDLYGLRIDLIRQSKKVAVNDSTQKAIDVQNRLVGFAIGEFLFADLNFNLSIRVDKLLKLQHGTDFHLEESTYPNRRSDYTYYQMKDGVLSTKARKRARYREQFNVQQTGDTLASSYKRWPQFKIIENEEGLFMKNGWSWHDRIFRHGPNHYSTSKRPKWGDHFYLENGQIHLDKTFIITTHPAGNAIEIHHWRGKKLYKPIYTIRYNQEEIIVYDRRQRGLLIRYQADKVEVFNKRHLLARYLLSN
ncbi:hypothetical protein [Roseimarinus sediminis]|uniref:hypothetical protein n=1 Tax=Roseimarinus sediminis TaxID=1610899 RepID=UPI003D1AEEA6